MCAAVSRTRAAPTFSARWVRLPVPDLVHSASSGLCPSLLITSYCELLRFAVRISSVSYGWQPGGGQG